MTKQYDTKEQIEAFDAYVKQNPAGRQVHHAGTLGYDDGEWKAFQEGWNAALAQPDYRAVKTYHEGKSVYVSQPEQEPIGLKKLLGDIQVSLLHGDVDCRVAAANVLGVLITNFETQPEQEPVAWVCYGAPGKRDIDFEEADINGLPIGTLLYTTPQASVNEAPKRPWGKPWVSLTDEDLEFWTKELGQEELGRGVIRAVVDHLKKENT